MIARFNKGRFYRHRNFLDVDMYVAMVTFESAKREYVELKVRWWHRTLRAFIPDAMRIDRVKVKLNDFQNWEKLESVG